MKLKLIITIFSLLVFSGCFWNPSVDDGVIRDENGTSIVDGGAVTTKVCDPINSSDCAGVGSGNLKVILQDQTTDALELYLYQETNNFTIATNSTIDQYIINVNAGHTLIAGDWVLLQNENHVYQAQVISVLVNAITMDTPLDFAYSTDTYAREIITNMAVDGSVTAQIFMINPVAGEWDFEWDMTRVICSIRDQTSMDTGTFGGLPALTRGFVLRKKNGDFNNFFNVKTNGEFGDVAFDTNFVDKAPSGDFGFSVRKTWAGQAKSGVAIRLDPTLGEELQGLVQDDLTGLLDFRCKPQGSLTN